MGGHRAVDRGDHRHLDVENVLEDFGAFAEDLVVARRCEEVETLGRDLRAELIPRPRQDDDVVVGIVADVAERVDQGLVHVAVEHQGAASCMQGDLQDAVLAFHPEVLVFVAIGFERVSLRRAAGLEVGTGGGESFWQCHWASPVGWCRIGYIANVRRCRLAR